MSSFPSPASPDDVPNNLRRARDIVMAHGWNATAYQILNRGIHLWFARDGDAVVGWVRHSGVFIVAGAPVCALERLPAVVAEWESFAARRKSRVCYFGAGERLESLLRRPDYARVLLGAQPTWQPRDWNDIVASRSSLRAQFKRALNKGVTIEIADARRARDDGDLRRCLENWIARRGLPALHFLVEPRLLDRLMDRQLLVAQRNGAPVGFAVLSPIPQRNGWLIEQIVRAADAPNGTGELLVDAALRFAQESGCDYATLGLTPLSRRAQNVRDIEHPLWLSWVLRALRAHARRFYHFDGIDAFKSKFAPQSWEPIYAISNGATFSPRTLRAIAAAFSAGSPERLILRALGKAGQQEIAALRRGEWRIAPKKH